MQPILPILSAIFAVGCADDFTPVADAPIRGPADPVEPSDLRETLDASAAAFSGTVTDVTYRLSTPDNTGHTVPFTFVTWRVDRAFRGVEEGGSWTLRCLGGARGNGRALFVSTLPIFQEGDEDVIFARTDEVDACPLVGGAFGRLRVVEGRVYDNYGTTIELDGDRLARGAWRYLDRANVFDVGGVPLRRSFSPREDSGAVGMAGAALLDHLDGLASQLGESAPAPAADPSLPIAFQSSRPYAD